MLLKSLLTSSILFVILIKKSKNELVNVNTENNTFSNESNTIANCSYPCLSICQADSVERLYNMNFESEDLQEIFKQKIQFYESKPKLENLSKYFNRNISLPCNTSKMYALLFSRNDKWSIYEDGKLYLYYDGRFRNQHQYCFHWKDMSDEKGNYQGTVFVPYVCSLVNNHFGRDQWKNWAMVFSLPFFLLTIFFYCFLPESKNCHGKCFIMYLTYLTLSYGLISYSTLSPGDFRDVPCFAIGFFIYFANISFLTWISIISYDTYITLTGFSYSALFRNYLFYGSIIPLVTTILAFTVQISKIADDFKPGIERSSCSFKTKRWSALLYYYAPHIIVLIFCLFMFIKLIIFLQHHEKNASKYAGKIKTSYKKRFNIYFRLFIFTGLIWFVEIVSYIMFTTLGNDNYVTIILDYFNALHGLFIFVCIISSSKFCRNVMKKSSKKRFVEHGLKTTISMDCSVEDDHIADLN